jgi:hypothetical protein
MGAKLSVVKKRTISGSLGAAIWPVRCIGLVSAALQQKPIAQLTKQSEPAITAPEATDEEGIPRGHF